MAEVEETFETFEEQPVVATEEQQEVEDVVYAAAAELPEIKLFGRWSCDDVHVSDMSLAVSILFSRPIEKNRYSLSFINPDLDFIFVFCALQDYIAVKEKYARFTPHSAGRYAAKRFRKAQCPIVERLTNSLMMKGRNNGKKLMAVRIVKHAFEIIYLLTDKNPLSVSAIPIHTLFKHVIEICERENGLYMWTPAYYSRSVMSRLEPHNFNKPKLCGVETWTRAKCSGSFISRS